MSSEQWAPLIFDQFTPYSYKRAISDRNASGFDWMAPVWVGEDNIRRLQAYAMLQGYRDNVARLFVPFFSKDELDALDGRREYGDAALLIETARSKMMGDQQSIVVTDAEKYDEAAANNSAEATAANNRQDELRQWQEDDRFTTKMTETERNGVTFGDGLYTLSWAGDKRRPVLLPYEPDCYFPVLDGVDPGEYPTKVHIAWELTDSEALVKYGERVTVVHRITYELVDVEDLGIPAYGLDYRTELATKVCVMTEAEFKIKAGMRSPDDLDEVNAIYMLDADNLTVNRKNLGIDFVPVIHIPNTVSEIAHFGRSTLTWVMQLIDDIHSVDSDIQASSDLTGNPMLVVKGAVADTLGVKPGTAISVSEQGDALFLSGAEGIAGLMNHRDGLLDRLAINSRITSAAQGRVDPTKVQAGIILQLSFGPLTTLIDEMRLARKDKYRLLFKFVQRFMIINKVWQGDVLDADLAFGAYLPSDRTGTVTDVVAAYGAKLISRETAMRMLIDVGFAINDIAEELKKIDQRDFEAADLLQQVTGNDRAVEEMLGVKVDLPDPQTIPPQPPAGQPPIPPENSPQAQ